MPSVVWIALAVNIVCFVAGAIWLTVNALGAWRHGWPALRRLSSAADELPRRVAGLESRVAALEPRFDDLERSTASLRASVAQARLLLAVALEAKHTIQQTRQAIAFARVFVPRR